MTLEKKNIYYNEVSKVLWIVLLLNWLVALLKIILGSLSRSASMFADGLHSFSDGASNIVGLIGIKFASADRDEDHPYGHKKFETFFSLGIAFMLGVICIELIKTGVQRIVYPVSFKVGLFHFMVMIVTLIINVFVMLYEYRRGKVLKSDILIADSFHTRADILTSTSVIVALMASLFGWFMVDALMTFVIACFIALAAFKIVKESASVLCDEAAIKDKKLLENIVLSIEGVKSCHQIRSRGRQDDVYVDLHVLLDAQMPLLQAHRISHLIEEAIKEKFEDVSDVVVHIEPEEK